MTQPPRAQASAAETRPELSPGEGPRRPFLTLVICTYNREDILKSILEDLARQTADRRDFEVLIVDNGSTDGTAARARAFCESHANARHVIEPRQGLAHARNRGWREGRGRYIGYLDDDCRLRAGWLAAAIELARSAEAALFGGPYLPFFLTQKPPWYRYGGHDQGDRARPLGEGEFLDGANLFVRRDVLDRLGGFDVRLGMNGPALGYGEETEFQRRLRRLAPDERILYEPRLTVEHLVPPEKMRLGWIFRQAFVSGRYARYVFDRRSTRARAFSALPGALFRCCGHAVVGTLLRDRRQFPYYQNYLRERVIPYVERLGTLYEQLLGPGGGNHPVEGGREP